MWSLVKIKLKYVENQSTIIIIDLYHLTFRILVKSIEMRCKDS